MITAAQMVAAVERLARIAEGEEASAVYVLAEGTPAADLLRFTALRRDIAMTLNWTVPGSVTEH